MIVFFIKWSNQLGAVLTKFKNNLDYRKETIEVIFNGIKPYVKSITY